MNTKQITSILSWLAAGLVLIIAAIGFALSYNALYSVAISNGFVRWAAVLWPLLIDFAMVVFSIGVVRAYVWREHSRWPWFLVGVFTIGTIVFNLVHAGGNVDQISVYGYGIKMVYLVGIVPPVALFLSFETLMSMIKDAAGRQGLIESVDSLKTKIHELRQAHASALAEAETAKTELAKYRTTLETIKAEIKDKQKTIDAVGQTRVFVPNPQLLTKEQRLPIVRDMISAGIADNVITESLTISDKTLGRYRTELNGQLK